MRCRARGVGEPTHLHARTRKGRRERSRTRESSSPDDGEVPERSGRAGLPQGGGHQLTMDREEPPVIGVYSGLFLRASTTSTRFAAGRQHRATRWLILILLESRARGRSSDVFSTARSDRTRSGRWRVVRPEAMRARTSCSRSGEALQRECARRRWPEQPSTPWDRAPTPRRHLADRSPRRGLGPRRP